MMYVGHGIVSWAVCRVRQTWYVRIDLLTNLLIYLLLTIYTVAIPVKRCALFIFSLSSLPLTFHIYNNILYNDSIVGAVAGAYVFPLILASNRAVVGISSSRNSSGGSGRGSSMLSTRLLSGASYAASSVGLGSSTTSTAAALFRMQYMH